VNQAVVNWILPYKELLQENWADPFWVLVPANSLPIEKKKRGVARETSPVTMCSNELAIKILFNHTQTANLLKSRTEKLDNILHAQGVFRRLNCLDKSFLPRND
jgi:hypothetical protein